MVCSEVADSEFILLIASAWRRRLPVVLAVLEAAGAEVASVDRERGIVEGRVDTSRLEALSGLAQVASLAWRPTGKEGCGACGPSHVIG